MEFSLGPSPVPIGNKALQFSRYTYSTNTAKDSKAQHILGISRAELRTARSQSLNPKSKFSSIRKSFRGKADVRGPQVYVQERSLDSLTSSNLDLHTDPIVLHDESVKSPETVSISDTASLSQHPSTSPSQSDCEIINTLPDTSQPITDSLSRPRPLRRRTSSTSQPKREVIEHARQLKFFKPTHPPSKPENTAVVRAHPVLDDLRPPIEKAPIVTQITSTPTNPLPPTSMPHATIRPSPKVLRKKALDRRHNKNVHLMNFDILAYTPYAKVNVRRPKAVTEHWFDSLDIETSDDEDNEEPELRQNFVIEVEHAFQNGRISNASPFSNNGNDDTAASRPVLSQHGSKSNSPPPNPTNLLSQGGVVSDAPIQNVGRHFAQPKVTRHPFAEADLTQESVLYLSSSDDDNKSHSTEQSLSPEQVATLNDEDTVNISRTPGLVANYQLPQIRPTKPLNLNSSPATPVSISSIAIGTGRNGQSTVLRDSTTEAAVDTEEQAMLDSFPNTPVDTCTSRKSSIRSSFCLSDDASIVSTRLMKVTRQEEALLAAMRLKKVAMKRAAKERNRKAALEVLETSKQPVSTSKELCIGDDSPNVDEPEEDLYHHRQLQTIPPQPRTGRNCESITTFQTDSYDNRNSEFTFLSDESEEQCLSSLPTAQQQTLLQNSLLESPFQAEALDTQRPDTFHSFTTDGSERRDNPIVVLDNLHSALRRRDIPSQLFIVSPFVGWDRAELAAAR